MNERVVLRLFCSKPKGAHVVGRVVATSTGLVVRFTGAVQTSRGDQGREIEMHANPEAAEATDAWCSACRKRLLFGINDAVASAELGKRSIVLVAEGMWRDPLGVLARHAVPPVV